jgi:hypothetical protein
MGREGKEGREGREADALRGTTLTGREGRGREGRGREGKEADALGTTVYEPESLSGEWEAAVTRALPVNGITRTGHPQPPSSSPVLAGSP